LNELKQKLEDAQTPKEMILVVDDVADNCDMLSRRLEFLGYSTATALDGYQALEWLDKNKCDLIMLDIMMPGMSGIEVLEKVRESFDRTQLPVIMATAKSSDEDVIGALKSGANDYVTKPLNFQIVQARVSTQLEMKRASDLARKLVKQVEHRNEFIRSVFGRYLTEDIAETLLDSNKGLDFGGERREITILFADIRGFSTISSKIEPEKVVTLVNIFLSQMTEVIISFGGTIDEFIGDAILVLFGAPKAMDDHAKKAVACAIEMQKAMAKVNEINNHSGLPEISTGIGVNTGEVIVGNIGSEKRAKYGVVGHHVNYAARVESYTKGGQVLVSERTYKICSHSFESQGEMIVHPKGFDEEIKIHDINCISNRENT